MSAQRPRTLAGDLEQLRGQLIDLAWTLTRPAFRDGFLIVLVALAIAGLLLGLGWGWIQ